LANATTDGVVRAPSALAMTVGSPPSRTATTEFVVPRSIPTARAMVLPPVCCWECLWWSWDPEGCRGESPRAVAILRRCGECRKQVESDQLNFVHTSQRRSGSGDSRPGAGFSADPRAPARPVDRLAP